MNSVSKLVLALALILAAGGLAGLSARGPEEPLSAQSRAVDGAGEVVSSDAAPSPRR
jgi:hypothetical protein